MNIDNYIVRIQKGSLIAILFIIFTKLLFGEQLTTFTYNWWKELLPEVIILVSLFVLCLFLTKTISLPRKKTKQTKNNNTLKTTQPLQVIIKNSVWIFLKQIFGTGLTALITIFIIRALSVAEYGVFAFAFSFVAIFTLFMNIGIPTYVLKETAYQKKLKKRFLQELWGLQLFLVGASTTILFFALLVTKQTLQTKLAIVIVLTHIIFQSLGTYYGGLFRAKEEFEHEAKIDIIKNALQMMLILFILTTNKNLYLILATYIVVSAISFFTLKIKYEKRFGIIKPRLDWKQNKLHFKKTIHYCISGIFGTINLSFDILIIGIILTTELVGAYGAIYKIPLLAYVLTTFFLQAILPLLSRNKNNKEQLLSIYKKLIRGVIPILAVIVFFVLTFEKTIIQILISGKYLPYQQILTVLIFLVPLMTFREIGAHMIYALDQQKKYTTILIVSGSINIMFNLLLIPSYGLIAAAGTTILSETINAIFVNRQVYKHLKKN